LNRYIVMSFLGIAKFSKGIAEGKGYFPSASKCRLLYFNFHSKASELKKNMGRGQK